MSRWKYNASCSSEKWHCSLRSIAVMYQSICYWIEYGIQNNPDEHNPDDQLTYPHNGNRFCAKHRPQIKEAAAGEGNEPNRWEPNGQTCGSRQMQIEVKISCIKMQKIRKNERVTERAVATRPTSFLHNFHNSEYSTIQDRAASVVGFWEISRSQLMPEN